MQNDEFINMPVPRRYVPKVYELIAALDSDESSNEPASSPSDNGAPSAALTEDLVKRMYRESWDPHQRLLTHLADHADQWMYTSEIATALELPHGARSLAGSMGAFGRRTNHRYGGLMPWETRWDPDRGEAQHRMRPEVATWVKDAAS